MHEAKGSIHEESFGLAFLVNYERGFRERGNLQNFLSKIEQKAFSFHNFFNAVGISKAKMDELRSDFGGMCKKCGSKTELQFAHVLPTKLCGKNSRGSQARYDDIRRYPLAYVLLCRECHDKTGPNPYVMRELKYKKKGFL